MSTPTHVSEIAMAFGHRPPGELPPFWWLYHAPRLIQMIDQAPDDYVAISLDKACYRRDRHGTKQQADQAHCLHEITGLIEADPSGFVASQRDQIKAKAQAEAQIIKDALDGVS